MTSAPCRAGDRVVAVRDFGGITREAIPAGASGRVVGAPWLGRAVVEFTPWPTSGAAAGR
jgi:hypothetical protein